MKPAYVEALLEHFMDMHISDVRNQAYCNVAWCLAVMQCLDLNTFEALLDKLATMHKLSVQEASPQSTSAQLTAAGATQLYQALAWLMPPCVSEQQKAWSRLRSRLHTVVPEPAFRKLSGPWQTVMWATLAMHEVPYKAQVQLGVYQADALLASCHSNVAEVILVLDSPGYSINNMPNR